MSLLEIIYLVTGGLICLLLELFTLSSIREYRARAMGVSSALLILVALLWFGGYFVFSPPDYILISALVFVAAFTLLYFLPTGSSRSLLIEKTVERYDERDVIFSREEYLPGSEKYEQYYSTRPEFKETDDKMRKFPELLEPGGRYYDAVGSARISDIFREIKELITNVDGLVSDTQQNLDPSDMTRSIKQKLLDLGADDVGIANLNPAFVYTHVGRGPEKWGEPIVNTHKFAIVFTLEMRYESVEAAPDLPISQETADRYLKAAQISIELADYIRALGYPARAHIAGSNYQVILPAVAQDAGLGELGRIGYLISPKFGARVRLGAITTDLPLLTDKPITFGVQDFCDKCKKCATNCPSGAIPHNETAPVRGVHKWQLNAEQCLHYWRAIGTDCGLCMRVCPYSHPPTITHNIVRAGIRHSAFARTVSVWGDDLFYGSKLKIN